MLIDKVCGLNEMEMNMRNRNSNSELKNEMLDKKLKSSHEFQSVFEYAIKREKEKYDGV